MKLKYLKKVVYSFFVCLVLMSPLLFSKDIEYQAEVRNAYDNDKVTIRWTNYVKSFDKDKPNYNNEGDIENHSALELEGTKSHSYQTVGVIFHRNPLSYYAGIDQKRLSDTWMSTAYDHGNYPPFSTTDNYKTLAEYSSKVNIDNTWITYGKTDAEINSEEILTVDEWNKNNNGYDLYNVKGETKDYFTINQFEINNNATKALYSKLPNGGKVYFSNILYTGWRTIGSYRTAWSFYHNMDSRWDPENYGHTGIGNNYNHGQKNENVPTIKGQAVVNNFDNLLTIPASKANSRNIYVTHKIQGTNEVMNGVQNSEAVLTDDGSKIQNKYSSTDKNGWQELYQTDKKITVSSANGGAGDFTYNGKTYTLARVKGYWMTDSVNWNSPDVPYSSYYKSINIDAGSQDYGLIFEYVEDGGKTPESVEVYVNYIDIDQNKTVDDIETFKKTLDRAKLNNLTETNVDRVPYVQKFSMSDSQSGEVKVKDNVFRNMTTITDKNGKNYSYVGVKSVYGSNFQGALMAGGKISSLSPNSKSSGVSISNTEEKRVYIVSFYFKSGSTPPPGGTPSSNIIVKGRLDFVNEDSKFIGSTYTNTSNDSQSQNGSDYIPANEKLAPYIYGAQPYFISAIKKGKDISTSGGSQTIDYTWKEEKGHDAKCTPGCTKDHSTPHTGSYTYKVKLTHTYNKITDLIMYRINKVNVIDKNDNIGGKLFTGDENFAIKTNSNYDNRSKAEIKGKSNSIEFNYDSSSYDGGSSEPTKSQVASGVNLQVTVKGANEYIKLDNSENLVSKNETSNTRSITEDTDISIDSTTNTYITNNINDYMRGTINWTTKDDFDYASNVKNVGIIPNGIRQLRGNIEYKKEIVRGSGTSTDLEADKVLQVGSVNNEVKDDIKIDCTKLAGTFNYDYDNGTDPINDEDNVRRVNVLTPLSVDAKVETEGSVNHSNRAESILQSGKEFTLKINAKSYLNSIGYSDVPTEKYTKGYYATFNFEFQYKGGNTNIKYYDKSSHTFKDCAIDTSVPANTDIYIEKSTGIEIKGIPKTVSGIQSLWSTSNDIKVVAITNTIQGLTLEKVFASYENLTATDFDNDFDEFWKRSANLGNFLNYSSYIDASSSTNAETNRKKKTQQVINNLIGNPNLYASAFHAVTAAVNTNNVGRIYDFRVTDCNDLAYKNVFRKNEGSTNISKHTEKVYYSGKNEFSLSNIINSPGATTGMSVVSSRTNSDVLPLAPYKNTDATNIFAPKLGYRISFDLKTLGYIQTGSSSNSKKIVIKPHYYYVSKDGTKYILPNVGADGRITGDNVKLYYKSSSGKYIDISNYSMYFKPNDGYRLGISTDVGSTLVLSSNLQRLSISELQLNEKMMQFDSGNYVQMWFGEYKLPNSTIAINLDTSNGIGHTTVNNPLNDGYIGVVFDIKSVERDTDGNTIEIYYNKNDSSVSGENTSEWDYEGYLGIVNPGSSYNTSLQLEKGSWNITNDTYKKIKGTVILYDIDNRASNDFN